MSKTKKTYEAVLNGKKNIRWADIETLFISLGAEVVEGNGSRVMFILNGHRANFHRPHPQKEARNYQVKQAAQFLKATKAKP